jgi:hypothetical protein
MIAGDFARRSPLGRAPAPRARPHRPRRASDISKRGRSGWNSTWGRVNARNACSEDNTELGCSPVICEIYVLSNSYFEFLRGGDTRRGLIAAARRLCLPCSICMTAALRSVRRRGTALYARGADGRGASSRSHCAISRMSSATGPRCCASSSAATRPRAGAPISTAAASRSVSPSGRAPAHRRDHAPSEDQAPSL